MCFQFKHLQYPSTALWRGPLKHAVLPGHTVSTPHMVSFQSLVYLRLQLSRNFSACPRDFCSCLFTLNLNFPPTEVLSSLCTLCPNYQEHSLALWIQNTYLMKSSLLNFPLSWRGSASGSHRGWLHRLLSASDARDVDGEGPQSQL